MLHLKNTKIIATIGPSSSGEIVLKNMIKSGLDLIRFNMSHIHDYKMLKRQIKRVRKISRSLDKHIGIIMDLCGPKLRVMNQEVRIKKHSEITMGFDDLSDIRCSFKFDLSLVAVNSEIKMKDGQFIFKTIKYKNDQIVLKPLNDGLLKLNDGINIPDFDTNIPILTDKDKKDLIKGLEYGVDWIALSFVRNSRDMSVMTRIFNKQDKKIPVLAKIEKPQAIDNIDKIIDAFDGILIARGDLGIETPIHKLPLLQKEILKKCMEAKKPVIVATQMLESMVNNPLPTRAEVNDIATAVYDGADAIMLSAETSIGDHPVESVKMMSDISLNIESSQINLNKERLYISNMNKSDLRSAISHAVLTISDDIKVKAIVVMTETGSTARIVANYRPDVQIFALSPNQARCNAMSLIWGVEPVIMKSCKDTDEMIKVAEALLVKKGHVKSGEKIIITAGTPVGVSGTTNLLKVHTIN